MSSRYSFMEMSQVSLEVRKTEIKTFLCSGDTFWCLVGCLGHSSKLRTDLFIDFLHLFFAVQTPKHARRLNTRKPLFFMTNNGNVGFGGGIGRVRVWFSGLGPGLRYSAKSSDVAGCGLVGCWGGFNVASANIRII